MDRLRRHQVFGPSGYPVAGAAIRLDAPVDGHAHDFLELAVVLEGEATYLSAAGRLQLRSGAVTAVRPGEWHGYPEPGNAVIGNLYVGEELLHTDLRWLLEIGDLGRFLLRGGVAAGRLDPKALTVVSRHLGALAAIRARQGSAQAVRAVGAAYGVLGEMADLELADLQLGASSSRPRLSPAVQQLLTLLSRRPAEPWTMSRLADEIGHSVSYLHHEFRSQLGLTPMAWLAQTRAELAASLLLQTDHPVGWVGRQVGWPDPNYFSRCFRRAYRMSPTAYRRRNT